MVDNIKKPTTTKTHKKCRITCNKYIISIVKVKDLQYCLPGILLYSKKNTGVVVSRADKSKSTTNFFVSWYCFEVTKHSIESC